MLISKNAYQNYETVPAEAAYPKYEILLTEPEVVIEKSPLSDCQWEDLSVNYVQENGFFKGFLVTLPVSISLWAIIIWSIKSLFF